MVIITIVSFIIKVIIFLNSIMEPHFIAIIIKEAVIALESYKAINSN